jgi:LysM repeat protein
VPFPLKQARGALVVAILWASVSLPAGVVSAQREHRVREGQTLSAIAQRYDVRVTSLAAANGLAASSMLRVGQVLRIPDDGVVFVQSGQTLSAIAHANGTTVADLARANHLRADSTLQVGQRLVLPGHEGQSRAAASRWGRPRHPGIVDLKRLGKPYRLRMRLVDTRGRARSAARRRLAVLMEHRRTGHRRLPTPRLLQVLTTISDHFGGRRIYVVSGFREPGGYTRETSRHTRGHAIDIRIDGVPNTVLRDFCRSLPRTGCGYYPRSTFVHVDVREHSAYWVDWSRPGEAPQYRRADNPPDDGSGEEGEENDVVAGGAEDAVDPEETTAPSDDEGGDAAGHDEPEPPPEDAPVTAG